MVEDPAIVKILVDLEDEEFADGVLAGRWRVVAFDYPRLDFVIAAIQPNGCPCEFSFRADLTNYPATAPMVQIWDLVKDCPLAVSERPKGGPRVVDAFKSWGSDTVYRPWDRLTGPHNSNARNKPHLSWHSNRRIVFIFEDIYGLLNSNARTASLRKIA